MHISCNFPGGNGAWTIDAEQQIITLKPDLRDSTGGFIGRSPSMSHGLGVGLSNYQMICA